MTENEQKLKWQSIVKLCIKNVKTHFTEIEFGVEFGAYIEPEHYFVSYVFHTDASLHAARQSGLTERINSYHKEQLKKHNYPVQGIIDCGFASQETCDREYDGNWYQYYK